MNKLKIICFYILSSILCSNPLPSDCFDGLYFSNKNIFNNQFFSIKAYLDQSYSDSLMIFVEKNKRFKVLFNNKILIGDDSKFLNFDYKANQLFIDKPDTLLNKWLLLKNDDLFFKYFKNNFFYDTLIFTNLNCTKIDSMKLNFNNNKINLYNIILDSLYTIKPDSFFDLNIDKNKVFIYDFR